MGSCRGQPTDLPPVTQLTPGEIVCTIYTKNCPQPNETTQKIDRATPPQDAPARSPTAAPPSPPEDDEPPPPQPPLSPKDPLSILELEPERPPL